jgi:peptide/nickel transport system substrate-binding protein
MVKIGRLAALLIAALATLALAACGEEEEGGGGKKGGSIRIGTVGPDSYDPVLYLSSQALEPLKLVYTPLLAFKEVAGDAGGDRIPGLAQALPSVSADGKTYRLRLRRGLRYSDGTPVRASDFEHVIKRVLKLAGPYSSFYTGIVGAADFQKKGDAKADIPGIVTNDSTGDITIKLTAPDSKFDYALALPTVGLTPTSKSPFKRLAKDPPPGLGPYTMKVVDPTRQYVLTKSRRFDIPGMLKGNVDKITGVVLDNVQKMTQDVIRGNLDFMTEDPTGGLLSLVRRKYSDRFRLDAVPPNTYWYFMNVTTKPFDKLEVRQAVNYALDSRALQRIFGGRLDPTCNFLPSAIPGYEKIDPCPYGDPNGPPDIPKAKRLVETSGYKGMTVTVWTNNKAPRPAIADYLRDVLEQIGFKAKTKILDEQVYFQQVGLKKTKAQIGFVAFAEDFPHPADFFEPNFSAKALASSPTFNFSFVADPKIDSTIKKLTPKDPKDAADQWAALDRYVVKDKALVAVYGNEKASTFFSERMDFDNCAGVHVLYKQDWAQFCLK